MASQHADRSSDAWAHFRHGAFTCTVVTDCFLQLGALQPDLSAANLSGVDALLTTGLVPAKRMALHQNVLAVDTGSRTRAVRPGC